MTSAHAASSQERNLAKYDKFGPIDEGVLPESMKKAQSDLRAFIWEHWRAHKLGYAIVTTWSPFEWVPCETKYYVEPDSKTGKWHIELDEEVEATVHHPANARTSFIAVSVERVDQGELYKKKRELIPDDWLLSADWYRLVLKDEHGESNYHFL